MLLESFVAMMALIAAASLQPGVFFAVNSPAGVVGATPAAAVATISGWGFPVTAAECRAWRATPASRRCSTAPAARLRSRWAWRRSFVLSGGGRALLAFWYHFAIMFEALFILTMLDSGTRVGRFMLQDMLGEVWPKLGQTNWKPGMLATSAVIVAAWGYFLYQGVIDPLGGINSLWPLFGIANQLLAAVALCVGTTILVKVHGARYMWVTSVPLAWLVVVCFVAG